MDFIENNVKTLVRCWFAGSGLSVSVSGPRKLVAETPQGAEIPFQIKTLAFLIAYGLPRSFKDYLVYLLACEAYCWAMPLFGPGCWFGRNLEDAVAGDPHFRKPNSAQIVSDLVKKSVSLVRQGTALRPAAAVETAHVLSLPSRQTAHVLSLPSRQTAHVLSLLPRRQGFCLNHKTTLMHIHPQRSNKIRIQSQFPSSVGAGFQYFIPTFQLK